MRGPGTPPSTEFKIQLEPTSVPHNSFSLAFHPSDSTISENWRLAIFYLIIVATLSNAFNGLIAGPCSDCQILPDMVQ